VRVPFEKWEGLGNDFVLLRAGDLPSGLEETTVRRLCDRRFGVGADGVLVVEAAGPGPARMIVRNADGSRPEMCGNGLRCVAGHLGREGVVRIATDAGEKTCEVRPGAGGDLGHVDVRVAMGVARRGADLVAVIGGREHRFLTVDMGNPHAVTFEAYDEGVLDTLGPAVASLPPGGTNVELCRQLADRIVVVVWERGVGRTMACGTGACAVAAAACETGRARFGEPLTVALPGGPLEVTVSEATRAVEMRGPAQLVFRGEVEIA
jgi:diaminopimelate epimerase